MYRCEKDRSRILALSLLSQPSTPLRNSATALARGHVQPSTAPISRTKFMSDGVLGSNQSYTCTLGVGLFSSKVAAHVTSVWSIPQRQRFVIYALTECAHCIGKEYICMAILHHNIYQPWMPGGGETEVIFCAPTGLLGRSSYLRSAFAKDVDESCTNELLIAHCGRTGHGATTFVQLALGCAIPIPPQHLQCLPVHVSVVSVVSRVAQ